MYVVAAVLSQFLVACGGGDGGGGSSTVITLADTADCFQIKSGNAMRFASTASPSQAQTPQLPGVNSSTTFYYENSVADVSYSPQIFGGALVTSRLSAGTETFGSASGTVTRVLSDTELFSSTPSFAIVGASESRPSINYFSATSYAGQVRPLAVPQGQAQNFNFLGTKTSSISGQTPTATVSVTSQTVTFLTREDVVTAAGTFRNSCKFNLDTRVTQSSTGGATPTASVSAGVNTTQWFAPGWGLVRQDSVERFTDTRQPASLSRNGVATAILGGSL